MNTIKTFLLLGLLSMAVVLVGGYLGGQSGALMALVLAGAMNFVSYFFSDRIVLKMNRARVVSRADAPMLYEVVESLTRRAGMPMPKVAIIPSPQPNAFATGRNPEHAVVAATEGILRILDRDELEGVMAHELAHVKNRDILIASIAATLAAALTYLVYFGRFLGGGRDRGPLGGILALVAILLVPLAAGLVQAAISRTREFGADAGGAEISGKPRALASALKKLEAGAKQLPMQVNPAAEHLYIVKPFSGRGMMSLFRSHPPTAERIERLLEMPTRA